MSLLETGFVARFREGGWSSKEIVLRDFSVRDEAKAATLTMAGQEYLPHFLPALEQHLQERGWLDKTVFHIADEPSNHNVMTWREASDFVHRYGPRLRRMDAIETPHCLDRLEVWVPKLDHYATWQEAYNDAQRRGNEMWFYTVGIFQAGTYMNKTVDVPLIQSRTLHWLNYRFGLTGYLHWGYNMWTNDPFEAPGQHCGDGWHVYPTKGGLLDSLRWEQMRNGIQDYEYFRLLEEKMGQMKKGMSQRVAALLDPRQRGVEIAARVVGTADDYSNDPNALYAAKRQIIDELLGLEQSPRLIVQTHPIEHSRVAAGAADRRARLGRARHTDHDQWHGRARGRRWLVPGERPALCPSNHHCRSPESEGEETIRASLPALAGSIASLILRLEVRSYGGTAGSRCAIRVRPQEPGARSRVESGTSLGFAHSPVYAFAAWPGRERPSGWSWRRCSSRPMAAGAWAPVSGLSSMSAAACSSEPSF